LLFRIFLSGRQDEATYPLCSAGSRPPPFVAPQQVSFTYCLIIDLLFDSLTSRVGEREDGERGCTHSPLFKGDTFNDSGHVVLRRCWHGAGNEIHSRRPYYGGSYRLGPDWFYRRSCPVGRSGDACDFGDRSGRFRARLLHRMLFGQALRPPRADGAVDATFPGVVEARNVAPQADLRALARSLKDSDLDDRPNEACTTRI
jgi:hypothetical protein